MPQKTKITKKEILSASLSIVRESGDAALNARAIAKKLNCSTQPIFSNYSTMEDVKADVMLTAKQLYRQYLEDGMKDALYPPYKASGIAYIRFAKEERELFKLLFMRDRSREEIKEEREEISHLLQLIASSTGMSLEEAYSFHIGMWIYVHGIATMIATAYLDWDWERVSSMLTEAYQGMKERYIKREDE